MKKIPLTVRNCRRKVSYLTKQEAENKAWLCKAGTAIKLNPYLCPVCDLWHLTHRPQ